MSLASDDADPAEFFQIIDKLGEGSYGEVYSALDRRSGRTVAIKVIPVEADMTDLRKEIDILKRCDSPYVVRYYGSYQKDGDLWIVMELCAAGSLADLMAIADISLLEEEIAEAMAITLMGLAYLHAEKRIIHRDLKAGNLLLSEDGSLKLADFGVSSQLSSTLSRRATTIGSPYWLSPEAIQAVAYDCRTDIWSLGITAIELADGEPPLASVHPMRAIFMIPTREPPTVADPSAWSPQFLDFLEQCLRKDFKSRPSAAELLRHPFVAGSAARVAAAEGRSPLLQELVAKCMPLIEEARREDSARAFGEAAAAPAAAAPAAPAASGASAPGGSATGTMITTGTMIAHGHGSRPEGKEGYDDGDHDGGYADGQVGDSGTMVVTGTMRGPAGGGAGSGGGGGSGSAGLPAAVTASMLAPCGGPASTATAATSVAPSKAHAHAAAGVEPQPQPHSDFNSGTMVVHADAHGAAAGTSGIPAAALASLGQPPSGSLAAARAAAVSAAAALAASGRTLRNSTGGGLGGTLRRRAAAGALTLQAGGLPAGSAAGSNPSGTMRIRGPAAGAAAGAGAGGQHAATQSSGSFHSASSSTGSGAVGDGMPGARYRSGSASGSGIATGGIAPPGGGSGSGTLVTRQVGSSSAALLGATGGSSAGGPQLDSDDDDYDNEYRHGYGGSEGKAGDALGLGEATADDSTGSITAPAFMRQIRLAAEGGSAGRGGGAASGHGSPAFAMGHGGGGADEVYGTDEASLRGLSRDELRARLTALDTRFATDMAALTQRYDAARAAIARVAAAAADSQ